MALYLGHPNNGAKTIAPSLTARGIDLLRASPADIRMLTPIDYKQPAFQSYINHLPAFMHAYFTRSVTPTNKECYPIQTPPDDYFPVALPALCVDFPRPLSTEDTQILSNIGFESITIRTKKVMVFNGYSMEQLRTIRDMKPNPVTVTAQNTVNLSCISPLMVVVKVFSAFFKTHSYPAFSDDDQEIVKIMDGHFEKESKRKRGNDDDGGSRSKPTSAANATDPGEDDDDMTEAPESDPPTVHLYKAKPPRINTNAWGSPTTIPNASGIFIAFVPDLATNDSSSVTTVIRDHFFQCLGTSATNCVQTYDAIAAWGNVYRTAAGDILAHMAFMIDLALRCQAAVYPIFSNGKYEGAILSGCRFRLHYRGSVFRPSSYADLQQILENAKLHDSVLDHIAAIAGEEDGVIIRLAGSMRSLQIALKDAELNEEERDSIKREVVHLSFPQRYWGVNATTIGKAFAFLRDVSLKIDDTIPLHPDQIFETDRVALVLSAFGYMAPTFLIPSTPSIKLVASAAPPKTFAVRTVALSSAVHDMHTMLKTKQITNNPANISKSNQDRTFNGAEKQEMWNLICGLVSAPTTGIGSNLGSRGDSGLPERVEVVEGLNMDDF
nr:MAG: hypothetical protein [Downy mildew lesion associated ambivirus 4]